MAHVRRQYSMSCAETSQLPKTRRGKSPNPPKKGSVERPKYKFRGKGKQAASSLDLLTGPPKKSKNTRQSRGKSPQPPSQRNGRISKKRSKSPKAKVRNGKLGVTGGARTNNSKRVSSRKNGKLATPTTDDDDEESKKQVTFKLENNTSNEDDDSKSASPNPYPLSEEDAKNDNPRANLERTFSDPPRLVLTKSIQNQLNLVELKESEENNLPLLNDRPRSTTLPRKKLSSKNKKPKLSQELQELVCEHYEKAKTKDFEQILLDNEPAFIAERNRVYAESREKGITEDSHNLLRLSAVEKVADWFFHNIEPPDAYTKNTDIKHYKDVSSIAIGRCKEQWMSAPLTLIISCWFHDCERFVVSTKCQYLPEAADKFRKLLIHPMTSARMCLTILDGSPIRDYEKQRIFDMICQHDKPMGDEVVMCGKLLMGKPSEEIKWELRTLMDSDSLAFFHSTIPIFIESKSKKNTGEWIWNRVRTNVRRLRPQLQRDAHKSMLAMSEDLKEKMAFNEVEMEEILAQAERDCRRELEEKRRQTILELQQKGNFHRHSSHISDVTVSLFEHVTLPQTPDETPVSDRSDDSPLFGSVPHQ